MIVSMISTDITKWLAWGRVVVRTISGWNNTGGAIYIQLHQLVPAVGGGSTAGTNIATGAVPLYKSLLAQANNGFFYTINQEFSECLIGLSSTETTYTAVATGLDISFDIDSQFACDGTETVVGDLSTLQNALQVWAEASGPKRLLRVDVQDNQNVTQLYALIYAVDNVTANSLVCSFFPAKLNSLTKNYYGDAQVPQGGAFPFQQDGGGTQSFQSGATYAAHRGCTINVTGVNANGAWTVGQVWGGTLPFIRAIYK